MPLRDVRAAQVVLSTQLDPFLSLKALTSYSGLSVRKLREYLVDPVYPLPSYRVGGKILVRRSEFDGWLQQFRKANDGREARELVDRIVNGFLR